MTTLVIASGNAGKVREFGQLLEGLGLNTPNPSPQGSKSRKPVTPLPRTPA